MTMRFPQPPIDPPDQPAECLWCDGTLIVTVAAISDCVGAPHTITGNLRDLQIECPRCDGSGNEPPADPLDDPRIP